MVKILKTMLQKHKDTMSPWVRDFVNDATSIPLPLLPQHLSGFPSRWPFPRGDLYHWIPLLNRFDSALEAFCSLYGLHDGPQTKDFTCGLLERETQDSQGPAQLGYEKDGDRYVIEAILDFSRMLLQNCGNRSIYASSPYLSDLLNSTSLSLVASTLQIGTQLAQRYQASYKRMASPHRHANAALLANHYNIDLDRVQQLAQPFVRTTVSTEVAPPTTPATPNAKGKEKAYFNVSPSSKTSTVYANDLVSIVKSGSNPSTSTKGKSKTSSTEANWNEWGDVRITYYQGLPPTVSEPENLSSASLNTSSAPSTPTPARRNLTLSPQHGQRTSRLASTEEPLISPARPQTGISDDIQSPDRVKIVEIPSARLGTSSIHELLEEYCPTLPRDVQFELLTKLRVAYALTSSVEARRQILTVRILAITNLAYIYTEAPFLEKVLKQDSDEPRRLQLIYQLADLIHPPTDDNVGVPRSMQTVALSGLKALAQHQTKSHDICTALNTNINHGVILYIVRKAVAEMAHDEEGDKQTEKDDWRDALFSLLSHVATLPRAGSDMVTAGLVPILVELLTLRTNIAERNYPQVLQFLDAIIFNVREAFQILVNSDGLDAISDLIIHEVKYCLQMSEEEMVRLDYQSPAIDYRIPYFSQQSLKWLFKFIHHMMTTASGYGGNFDRLLRNLIDSSPLLASLKKIIGHSPRFGSTVWTNSVTILNDFINNEPTSFAVIAEAGLSREFLQAVTGKEIKFTEETKESQPNADSIDDRASAARTSQEDVVTHESANDIVDGSANDASSSTEAYHDSIMSEIVDDSPHPPTSEMLKAPRPSPLANGIMPSSEAIQVIPQAFGAICLNNSGMKMFQDSNALQSFFEIFESPKHVQCMETERNLSTALGGTFDELVRHHPSLKNAIINAILDMVARVAHLCKVMATEDNVGSRLWLVAENDQVVAHDSSKGKGKATTSDSDIEMSGVAPALSPSAVDPPNEGVSQTSPLPYINAISNFLSLMFNNTSVRTAFMEKGGAEFILSMASVASLNYDFGENESSRALHTVICLLAEHKPHLVVPSLLKRVQAAADTLIPFTRHEGPTSYFAGFVSDDTQFQLNPGQLEDGTRLVKALVNIQSLLSALHRCFQTPVYNHRSSTTFFNQLNLSDYYVRLVEALGPLLAAATKEDYLLQKSAAVPSHWKRATRPGADRGILLRGEDIEDLDLDLRHINDFAAAEVVPAGGDISISGAVSNEFPPPQPLTTPTPQIKFPTKRESQSARFKNFQSLRYLLGKMPPTISSFFQMLGKSLIANKRSPDTFQRQSYTSIAEALAETVLNEVTPIVKESSVENYTFWIVMLSTIKDLLVHVVRHSERPCECITLVLQAFKARKGFEVLNTMLEVFSEDIRQHTDQSKTSEISENEIAKDRLKLSVATLGMGHILNLYLLLVTGKNVHDSPQTQALLHQAEKDKTKPNWFSTGQLVVELRMAILPTVRRLWESDMLEKADHQIPNRLIEIIQMIALADNELGALRRSDKVPAEIKAPRKTWKPNTDSLSKLNDAGFDTDLAREALYRTNGSHSHAAEYCRAQNTEYSGGRNPIPLTDLDTADEINGTAKTGPSTGTATPLATESEVPTAPVPAIAVGDWEPAPGGLLSSGIASLLARRSAEEVTIESETSSFAKLVAVTAQSDIVTVDDLNAERAAIRDRLIERCLDVINAHGEVTFEVSDLITTVVDKSDDPATMRKEMGETLVNALMSFAAEDDVRIVGKKVAAYAHLLALMLRDRAFYIASVTELKENLPTLLEFVKLLPTHSSEESSPWIAHILLIIETLLSEDAQPREFTWTFPSLENPKTADPVLKITEPIVSPDHRGVLFEYILDILPRIGKDESLALAVLRVLVILTRARELAQAMGEKKNIQRLFVMAKQLAGATSARLQTPLMLILRHIIEDDETIKQVMRSDIKLFFESPRSQRHHDVQTYLHQLSSLVIRAPGLFVDVTNEMVKLAKWAPAAETAPGRQVLVLKDQYQRRHPNELVLPPLQATGLLSIHDVKPTTEAGDAEPETTETSKLPPIDLPKVPVVENPDGVIHFLLCEILNYKDVEDKDPAAQSAEKIAPKIPSSNGDAVMTDIASSSAIVIPVADAREARKPSKAKPKWEDHPIFIYRCFLLQCLTELLSSYNRTKVEFINFKRSVPPQAMTPSKPRSTVINYLLNDLIPIGTLEHADSIAMQKNHFTSTWAKHLLTGLLSKTGEHLEDMGRHPTDSEDEPDLLFVRKFVLENILKAYKDASSSSESLDAKYSRMLSLADLISHIMAGKDSYSTATDPSISSRSGGQLKRLMFEKGFVAALTGSIADIDLNFPNAKRAVKHILRPLKVITQTAIDLSESGVIFNPGQPEEDDIVSASSVSDVEDDRENTPDLFRNSTLGMFEPGRDEESSSGSEDEDEEMYEGEFDDEEMDYGDDMAEDDEDNVSDEDEEIEGMGPIEGLSGDVDVEVIMDEDDDDEDDDDGLSDEDSDEDSDGMDEDDEDQPSLVIDEHGHALRPLQELGDEDEWEDEGGSEEDEDDDAEEEDYEGRLQDDEELRAHGIEAVGGHGGTIGSLMRAFGGDDHEGAVEILQRIEDEGMDPDEQMELEGYLEGEQDDEDDEEDDDDRDDDDEGLFEGFRPQGIEPVVWDEESFPPNMVLSRHGNHHRSRHGIPSPFPYFPGGPRDPLGVPDYGRPSYRSHRPGPIPRTDEGMNPLLQRNGSRDEPRRGLAAAAAMSGRRDDYFLDVDLRTRVPPFGESPVALLNDLITSLPLPGALHRHGHLHFHVTGGPRGEMSRDLQAMFGMTRGFPPGMSRFENGRQAIDEPGNVPLFSPQTTVTRWTEEAKLLFGSGHIEKAFQKVLVALMAVLVPPALQQEIDAQKIAEEAKKKREEEEAAAKAKKNAEEKAAKEKVEADAKVARDAAEAAEQARKEELAAAGDLMSGVEGDQVLEEAGVQPMEGVETEVDAPPAPAEDGPAENRPRIVVTIRGNQIDITDLGIDEDFLRELPEEIQEEVITSAVTDRRSQAAAAGGEPSEIDQEFLDALPAEIRDEIIQQERQDRRRREREEQRRQAQASGPALAAAQDMDAGSILATLTPELRRQVLLEQNEEVLAHLPPELAAQARAGMRDNPVSNVRALAGGRPRPIGTGGEVVIQKKRPTVQMLDKAGVATLLRLMFVFQQDSLRGSLYHVLQNVSENKHNRAEVVSTLLHILQDGSADMSAVERSFTNLSLRAKQPKDKDPKTPQPLKRTLTGTSFTNSSLSIATSADVSPLMVVQQCLSTLIYLSKVNLQVPGFFLTEHESGPGLKRSTSRLKGKSKDTKAHKFAVNSLLTLLDRKLIMESSSVMELLSDLLSRCTQPLQSFVRTQKKAEEAKKAPQNPTADTATPEIAPPSTAVDETATEASEVTVNTETSETALQTEAATNSVTVTDVADAPSLVITGISTAAPESSEKPHLLTHIKDKEVDKKKERPFAFPVIPETNLKLIVNIFVARECSNKTFRDALITIKNLSCIPGVKAIFGKELVRKAQELGETILLDLEELLPQIHNAATGTEIQGLALTKFSPSSSDQNKLLRVLAALDHLFSAMTTAVPEGESNSTVESSEKQDLLATLYENSTFGPMWEKLSACLSAIRLREHMLNVATILLPLIESLMVVCKNMTLKDAPQSQVPNEMNLKSPPPETRMENLFFIFTEEHRKILNDLVRHTPKLMSGNFSLLVKNPKVLEFDNKRNYFNRSIHNRATQGRPSHAPLQLSVRRDQVFHDSFKSLYFKNGDEMKFGKLSIRFHGEEGVDAGGVTREWFQVLSRQMFDPGYALFVPVSSDRTTFHPNSLSSINPEHLMFFKFIGRVIGKALYEGRVLDCHFSRAVYKRILGKVVSNKDMESLDPEYYKSIAWMSENDITDIITETFSVDKDTFGVIETIDLKENGRNIPVTQDNKQEYIRLMVEYKLTGSVREQLDEFLKGFHDIIPAELIAIFNEQELELLISGLPEIDVDDWKGNTEYHNYSGSSPQIQWFWRAVRSFDKEERAKLLQFVTGTSKVPLNGFRELEGMNGFSRFNIHRDYGNKDRLPSSHTCFNQLDLPEYENYEALRQQVLMAITAGSEYFGFA